MLALAPVKVASPCTVKPSTTAVPVTSIPELVVCNLVEPACVIETPELAAVMYGTLSFSLRRLIILPRNLNCVLVSCM